MYSFKKTFIGLISGLSLLATISSGTLLARSHSSSSSSSSDAKIPLVVFSDATNFDDSVALTLLCKAENIDLKAVYITGNNFSEPGAGARNVFNLIDWLHHEKTKVVIGSFYSLLERDAGATSLISTTRAAVPFNDGGLPYTSTMWGESHLLPQSERHYVAKDTATAATQDDAVSIETLREVIANSDKPVTILSLGSLTGPWDVLNNAGSAVIGNVEKFVIMGGAFIEIDGTLGNLFDVPYNTTTEFNHYVDPVAAENLYELLADNSIPVLSDPLNATNTTPLTHAFLNKLRKKAKTPEAKFISLLLDRVAETWFDPVGLATLYVWDATAAMTLIDPKIITSKLPNQGIMVDDNASLSLVLNTDPVVITATESANFGQTLLNSGETNATIITSFNADRFYNDVIKVLNSKHNSASCPLKEPEGCYKYKHFDSK